MQFSWRDPEAMLAMPDDKLTPADPEDLTAALAFALRYAGHKRVHNADEIMAELACPMLRPCWPTPLRSGPPEVWHS